MIRRLTLALLCATLAPTLSPQKPLDDGRPVPVFEGVVQANAPLVQGPDVPAPPRAAATSLSHHDTPSVPIGVSELPAPHSSAATAIGELAPESAGDYAQFSNVRVKSGECAVGEPTLAVASDGRNMFYTANWHAQSSTDGGQSWNEVNPYSQFGSRWGGFCCDQKVISDDGLSIWLLQYRKDGNGNGGIVLAAATSDADLGANRWSSNWSLDPQNFGFSDGYWFDFPDIAFSSDYFFLSINVFRSTGGLESAIVARIARSDIADGGSLTYQALMGDNDTQWSFRLAQGPRSAMYMATHVNTGRIRIHRWSDSGGLYAYERDISTWTRGLTPHAGPDGRSWIRNMQNRILAGYRSENEVGFLWRCNQQVDRPNNYVRLARFDVTGDGAPTRIEDYDLWNRDHSVAYPAAAANAWGHVGVIVSLGGGTRRPSCGTALFDDLEKFSAFRLFTASDNDPNEARWGDYFTVQAWPTLAGSGSFAGTGVQLSNGSNIYTDGLHKWIHFGRESMDEPNVTLMVVSSPVQDIPISLTPTDRTGDGDLRTPAYRGYAGDVLYRLEAPVRHVVDNDEAYRFRHWRWWGAPGVSSDQPVGEPALHAHLGTEDDRAEAIYAREWVLDVQTSDPGTGVGITVSPVDADGNGYGTSSFTRYYLGGEQVTLVAPFAGGLNRFGRWRIDGVAQTEGQRTITVTMDEHHTVRAEFGDGICYEPDLGTALGARDDSIHPNQSLGFDFPIPGGGTTNAISISSNGFFWLDGAATANDWTPNVTEFLNEPARIAPLWRDMTLGGEADDVYFNSFGDRAVITWHRARDYQSSDLFTVQCTLYPDGTVHTSYSGTIPEAEALVGWTGNTSADPGGSDFSSAPFDTGAQANAYERFRPSNAFDLTGRILSRQPNALGGSGVDLVQSACAPASTRSYGSGCGTVASFYDFGTQTDLYDQEFELTPNGAGGYDVDRCATSCYETTLGTAIRTGDDRLTAVPLPFAFPYPGNPTGSTAVSVCSNGFLWLEDGSSTETDYSPTVHEFLNSPARVAALWTDLNPDGAGADGIYVDSSAQRVVITWHQIPEYQGTQLFTFQLQLFDDGRIVLAYQGDIATSTDALVGFTPGDNATDPGHANLLAAVPFRTARPDLPPLSLSSDLEPILGSNLPLRIDDVPAGSPSGVVLLGVFEQNLALDPIGMPGCTALNTAEDALPFAVGVSSTAIADLPIPNLPAILGASFQSQAFVIAPGANTLGLVSSNGLELTFGEL